MTLAEFDLNISQEAPAQLIVGVDEAGRGPLAGPVVAAACFIPQDLYTHEVMLQINDSKKLTPAKRQKIYNELIKLPVIYCTGFASAREIDDINILQATFLAMRRALAKFEDKSIFALIDGNHTVPNIKHRQKAVIGGDAASLSIAAASVIAKVTRDTYMDIIHQNFPQYSFCDHKGYGTKKHVDAIKQHGPCTHHRKSFEPISSLCYGLFAEIK